MTRIRENCQRTAVSWASMLCLRLHVTSHKQILGALLQGLSLSLLAFHTTSVLHLRTLLATNFHGFSLSTVACHNTASVATMWNNFCTNFYDFLAHHMSPVAIQIIFFERVFWARHSSLKKDYEQLVCEQFFSRLVVWHFAHCRFRRSTMAIICLDDTRHTHTHTHTHTAHLHTTIRYFVELLHPIPGTI